MDYVAMLTSQVTTSKDALQKDKDSWVEEQELTRRNCCHWEKKLDDVVDEGINPLFDLVILTIFDLPFTFVIPFTWF